MHQVRVQFHVVSTGPPLLPSFSQKLCVGQKVTFRRSIKGTHQNDEPTVATVRKGPRSHLCFLTKSSLELMSKAPFIVTKNILILLGSDAYKLITYHS